MARSEKTLWLLASLLLAVCLLASASASASGSGSGSATESTANEADEASKTESVALSWTPAFSLQFRAISSPALSPDGDLVAFVVREALTEGEKSEYLSQVWVAATDGSWTRQYTYGTNSAGSPTFSPDGKWLAFTSKREEGKEAKTQIYRMRVAGGEATRVTKAKNGVSSFAFSPDGEHIAYLQSDPETKEEKKAKKEKRDPILVDQNFKYQHLYIHLLDDNSEDGEATEDRRLTEGDFHITGFDWAPDGKRIVFGHQSDPLINTGMIEGDLSTVDVASGEVKSLVDGAGAERSPRYSPDGRWVAYDSSGDKPEPVGLGDVYIVAADGSSAPQRLEFTHDRRANIIGWRQDASAVVIMESVGTTRQLVDVPVEGPIRTISTIDGAPAQGVLGSATLSSDGSRFAFTHQTPDAPVELFVSSAKDFSPKQLTSLNREIELPPMGRTEVISWTSKDGGPVEGLITYPVGFEAGSNKKVPLILNVHGGPAGVFSQGFTGGPNIYLLQYFAEKGYAILRPNPRGSTGYGRDFRFHNVRDWGFGDYEDLMSGVDWAIQEGVADPERMYVMGWSYGGYMTSFVITRTDRFRAASMGAGLPNLVSMVHTTDIPDYLAAHQGAELWEDIEEYERHSAMYHLDKVKTPTQILHGVNDLRVPFDQGRELYLGLKRLGVATEMVAYPRTPHGPREPKLLIDVSPRILKWFEAHTPGMEKAAGDDDVTAADP